MPSPRLYPLKLDTQITNPSASNIEISLKPTMKKVFAPAGYSMHNTSVSPLPADGAYVQSADGHRYLQTIVDQYINFDKLSSRLNQLLGEGKYSCEWHQNYYIIKDAPRALNPVSFTLPFHLDPYPTILTF